MEIKKTLTNDSLVVALEGRLDTSSSPELEDVLDSSLDGVKELVFDLEQLDYLSSAGLRVLLTAQKRMGRQGMMKLRHLNATVREVLDVTGFSDFLTIE